MTMWLPVKCDECGEVVPASTVTKIEEKQVCASCLEEADSDE